MKTIKLGSKGSEVIRLTELLGIEKKEVFDEEVKRVVQEFQKTQGLDSDGIVGSRTWLELFIFQRLKLNNRGTISQEDYEWASEYLDCEDIALKALITVETGNKSGFEKNGLPMILFEGHIFWKELKNLGIDPEKVSLKYPSICYKSWSKQHYIGGEKEWERFEIASVVSRKAAILSTSFGLFQILGQNYKKCGCKDEEEFFEGMCKDQLQQFIYGVCFLKSTGINEPLGKKDWVSVARKYNGSGQVSEYSKRLETEYNKLKKK